MSLSSTITDTDFPFRPAPSLFHLFVLHPSMHPSSTMQVAIISQLSLPSLSLFLSLCILFTFPFLIHYPIQLFFLLLSEKHFSWRSNSPFDTAGAHLQSSSSSSSSSSSYEADDLCVRRFEHADEQEKCIVCLGKIAGGDEIRELRCCHLFHKACLDQWIGYRHSTCPICRCTLRPRQELDVGDKEEELEELVSLYSSYFSYVLQSIY